jgi:hypothetical protein
MSQQPFEIGDVVSYKADWFIGEAIGIVVYMHDYPNHVYLNWISAPKHRHLRWSHPEGDFIGDVQFMSKITHLEPDDVPIQK